jgi:hypothetical protein
MSIIIEDNEVRRMIQGRKYLVLVQDIWGKPVHSRLDDTDNYNRMSHELQAIAVGRQRSLGQHLNEH